MNSFRDAFFLTYKISRNSREVPLNDLSLPMGLCKTGDKNGLQ